MLAEPLDTDAADSGPRSSAVARLCVATRQVRPVSEMIRFVVGPDGVVPDLKRRLPGRGVWIGATRGAVAQAVSRGAIKRSLRADITVRPDLADFTDRLLARAALDALSIARKAGQVVAGFAKVEGALSGKEVAALIHAAEAGPDGVRKLALAAGKHGEDRPIASVRTFTSAELDLALARPNVVHAALLAGRAAETFLARWRDLERFRTDDPDLKGQRAKDREPRQTAHTELGSE